MKPSITAAFLISAVSLAGCATSEQHPQGGPVMPPVPGRADPYLPPQINLSDADLHDVTAFGPPRLTRDPAGLLHVDIPIRNTTPDQFPIDYRITYYDQNGIPLGPPANWAPVTLAPNVFQDIQANCWTPRGYDFKMDLRYAR